MRSISSFLAIIGSLWLLTFTTAKAQWAPGHIFIYDNIWQDADVLEYDADGNLVRSLRAGLPTAGSKFSGYGHLRWGPDGDLYQFSEYYVPGDTPEWRIGTLHWASDGSLVSFDALETTSSITGFAVLDNGNWLMVGNDGGPAFTREYSRDFSTYTEFPTSGDEGAAMHGGLAYVAANHFVQVLDPKTHALVNTYDTQEDNNDIAVAPGGNIAVNYQWANATGVDYVEVLGETGVWLGNAIMPDQDYRCHTGLAFDAADRLYVACDRSWGTTDDRVPRLRIYDTDQNFLKELELAGWRSPGSLAVVIPEPATLGLLALGGLAILRKRRP